MSHNCKPKHHQLFSEVFFASSYAVKKAFKPPVTFSAEFMFTAMPNVVQMMYTV